MSRSGLTVDLFLARKPKKFLVKRGPKAAADNPAFQEIWAVVGAIPRGSVSTYGAVARAAGLPGRARMAGRALRESPKEMKLPWHRVVGAGGKIVFPRTSLNFREQARRLRRGRRGQGGQGRPRGDPGFGVALNLLLRCRRHG